MLQDALLAYAHFFFIIATIAMLAVELALVTRDATSARLYKMRIVDGIYGMAASMLFITGVLRAWLGAKGSDFYLSNPIFLAKVALYFVVAALSIYPTLQYFEWASTIKATPGYLPPDATLARVRLLLKSQMVLLAVIPLLATLMVRGIGH
jgi:putative membrane protein